MLIVGQAHAVLKELVERAAYEVGALHILKHDAQRNREHVGLVDALIKRRLNNREAISAARSYRAVARAAGQTVGHGEGGNIVNPAAARLDNDIAGICNRGQRLTDERVALFKLAGKKRITGGNTGSVHSKDVIDSTRSGGHAGRNHAAVGSAHILKSHYRYLLSGVIHRQYAELGDAVNVSRARPLAVSELDGVRAVGLGLETTNNSAGVRSISRDADVDRAAEGRSAALALNIDSAALEHGDGLAHGVLARALVKVIQHALDFATGDADELGSGSRRAHRDNRHTVVLERGAERNRCSTTSRAGINYHVGLASIATREPVRHVFAYNLRIEPHTYHSLSRCCEHPRSAESREKVVEILHCGRGGEVAYRGHL